jgi:GNAT superfamily N-acetyltransferase
MRTRWPPRVAQFRRSPALAHVQSEHTFCKVTSHWASHLGCSTEALFAQPLHIVTHGADLAEYDGIFALFRGGAATVSFPPDRVESLRRLLPSPPFAPAHFADAFGVLGFTVIGPAYIGYAEAVHPFAHAVCPLSKRDTPAAGALQAACTKTEWDHGGSLVGEHPSSGVFVGSDLVALAGYEVWGSAIAHISVITHPGFRSRGFGRSAVGHLAGVALAAGLVPQYRTLQSNRASIRIAESLGFIHYASSVAVRLNRAG